MIIGPYIPQSKLSTSQLYAFLTKRRKMKKHRHSCNTLKWSMISFLQIFLQPSLCNAYRGSPTYAVFTNADPTMYRVFWLMYAQVGDFCVSSGSPTVPLTRILRNEVFSSRKIKGDLMQKSQFKHVNSLE